ncbi:hypothetical protein CXB77_05485 (plasmid) [Chromatium okenii]|uniref:Uncharacterized protein n=1 Tax=Chromatium okenii TaxID=61644 RepID=A0A2S7XT03_9GAMM|nr:hypothetical protein CXB77_05485 [Chromatium okenii]
MEAEAVKATETSFAIAASNLNPSEFLRNYLITQLQKVNKTELKSNQIVVRLRKTPAASLWTMKLSYLIVSKKRRP